MLKMKHIMFDIDGTLIQSYELDSQCFVASVKSVLGVTPSADWGSYKHTTDSGILREIISNLSLSVSFESIEEKVKQAFLSNLKAVINKQPIIPIDGAITFFDELKDMEGFSITIATGGWKESAILKLKSAGFDLNDVVMASADDHYSRAEIMKHALPVSIRPEDVVYFGDGEWDKKACEELGFQFVLVGNRFNHSPQIPNFCHKDETIEQVLSKRYSTNR